MTLLIVDKVTKCFNAGGGIFGRKAQRLIAVDEISLELAPGEKLGVVGESGSGKTTLGRLILGLYKPDSGRVLLNGIDVHRADGAGARAVHSAVQMIFQDNAGALDPRLRIQDAIAEPLAVQRMGTGRAERREIARRWLEKVGLDVSQARNRPHELSGGQRQRVGIARALAVNPKLLVADEPVASLDISVQTQILRLLSDLVNESGVALFFISHDLRIVRALTQRVLVMYKGRPVEMGPAATVTHTPLHPYTQSLIQAIPALHPDQRHILQAGTVSPETPAEIGGCAFAPRCPKADARCREDKPQWREVTNNHWLSCFKSAP